MIRKHCQRSMTKILFKLFVVELDSCNPNSVALLLDISPKTFPFGWTLFRAFYVIEAPSYICNATFQAEGTRSDGDVGPKWFTDATVHTTHTSIWLNLANLLQLFSWQWLHVFFSWAFLYNSFLLTAHASKQVINNKIINEKLNNKE